MVETDPNYEWRDSSIRIVISSIPFFVSLLLCFILWIEFLYFATFDKFLFFKYIINDKDNEKNQRQQKKHPMRLKFKILSIVGISFFIITISCYINADIFNYNVFWGVEAYAFVSLFWGHGNLFSYLLFAQRIHTIFGRTQFAASWRTYLVLYFGIFFLFFCQVYIVIFFFLGFYGLLDLEIVHLHLNIANNSEIFIQFLVSFALIHIFLTKLIKLASLQDTDRNSHSLLYVATRQTVLSSFCAFSTVIWLTTAMVMIIDWLLFINSSFTLKNIFHFATGIGLMLDCVFNSFAIFLSFSFSKDVYDKLCNFCHQYTSNYVYNKTRKTRKKRKNSQQQHQLELHQQQHQKNILSIKTSDSNNDL